MENYGTLPMTVRAFDVSGAGCRAFGFEVHGCGKTPFELKPGVSKTVRPSPFLGKGQSFLQLVRLYAVARIMC